MEKSLPQYDSSPFEGWQWRRGFRLPSESAKLAVSESRLRILPLCGASPDTCKSNVGSISSALRIYLGIYGVCILQPGSG